jgi:hypothetical protein
MAMPIDRVKEWIARPFGTDSTPPPRRHANRLCFQPFIGRKQDLVGNLAFWHAGSVRCREQIPGNSLNKNDL